MHPGRVRRDRLSTVRIDCGINNLADLRHHGPVEPLGMVCSTRPHRATPLHLRPGGSAAWRVPKPIPIGMMRLMVHKPQALDGPAPATLGPRIIRHQRVTVLRALRRAHYAWKHPSERSPAQDTRAWVETHPQRQRKALGVHVEAIPWLVSEFARVADEHAAGLSIIVGSGEILPIAGTALVRAVQEAVLQACWLCDPDITPSQRALRSASSFMHMVEGGIGPLRQMPAGARDLARMEPNARAARDYLRRGGFDVKVKGDRVIGLELEGQKVGSSPNMTELTNRFLPGDEYLYALGSGAAHGRAWFTRGLEGSSAQMMQMVVLPILALHDALAGTCLRFVGLDPEMPLRETHRRRVALSQYTPREWATGDWKHYYGKLRGENT